MYRFIMILAGAAALAGTPAYAQAPVAVQGEAAAGETVELPFAPPLGRTLRYRLVRERSGARGPERHEVHFNIAFRRVGADYVMSSLPLLPAGVPRPPESSPFALVVNRPTEFRIGENGEIIELLDLERHWEAAEAGLAELDRANPNPRAREAAAAVLRRIRAMPPDAQIELFSRNIAPVIGAAGATFPIGRELRDERTAPSIGGSLQQSSTESVTHVDDFMVRLVWRASVPSAELEARARALYGPNAPPGQGPAAFRVISNDVVQTYEVSRATGLTERFRSETVVVGEEQGQLRRSVDILTLELLP